MGVKMGFFHTFGVGRVGVIYGIISQLQGLEGRRRISVGEKPGENLGSRCLRGGPEDEELPQKLGIGPFRFLRRSSRYASKWIFHFFGSIGMMIERRYQEEFSDFSDKSTIKGSG